MHWDVAQMLILVWCLLFIYLTNCVALEIDQSKRSVDVPVCENLKSDKFKNYSSQRQRYYFYTADRAVPNNVTICTWDNVETVFASQIIAVILKQFFRYDMVVVYSFSNFTNIDSSISCSIRIDNLGQSHKNFFHVNERMRHRFLGELFVRKFFYSNNGSCSTSIPSYCQKSSNTCLVTLNQLAIKPSAKFYLTSPFSIASQKSILSVFEEVDPKVALFLSAFKLDFHELIGMELSNSNVLCNWIATKLDNHSLCEWCTELPKQKDKKILYLAGMFPAGRKFSDPSVRRTAESLIRHINTGQCSDNPQPYCKLKQNSYEIQLIGQDMDCNKTAELGFYIDILRNASNQPLLGIIGATCSDTIEPVVEASNNFKTVIISPTVESPVYSEQYRFPYFYRTIPSYEPYAYTITKFLKNQNWDNIGLLIKSRMFLNKTALAAGGNMSVCYEEVVSEDRLNYKTAFDNLRNLKEVGCQVVAMDYFNNGTCLYLCAAASLGFTPQNDYMFIFAHWTKSVFVSSPEESLNTTNPIFCDYILQPYYDNKDCNPEQVTEVAKSHLIVKNYVNTTNFPRDKSVVQSNLNDLTDDYFDFYTNDSVTVLANSIANLLTDDPSSVYHFTNAEVVNSYLRHIAVSNFSSGTKDRKVSFNDVHNVKSGSMMVYLLVLTSTTYTHSSGNISNVQYFQTHPFFIYEWETFQNGTIYSSREKMFELHVPGFRFIRKKKKIESCGWTDMIRELLGREDLNCQQLSLYATLFIVLLFLFLFVVIIFSIFKYFSYKYKQNQYLNQPFQELRQELSDMEILVSKDSLIMNRKLGEGAFGLMVYGLSQMLQMKQGNSNGALPHQKMQNPRFAAGANFPRPPFTHQHLQQRPLMTRTPGFQPQPRVPTAHRSQAPFPDSCRKDLSSIVSKLHASHEPNSLPAQQDGHLSSNPVRADNIFDKFNKAVAPVRRNDSFSQAETSGYHLLMSNKDTPDSPKEVDTPDSPVEYSNAAPQFKVIREQPHVIPLE